MLYLVMMNICKIENCRIKHYAKQYCRKHYAALVERGGYSRHKCAGVNCLTMVTKNNKYCWPHKKRAEKGLSLNLNSKCFRKGEENNRWNGGISEYPNHYLMKKNRIKKLKLVKGRCEICNSRADRIHHIDENKRNHNIENLLAVCSKCHGVLHRGKEKSSKYKQIYGLNLQEMVNKFGHYTYYYCKLHTLGLLKNFIDRPNNFSPYKRFTKKINKNLFDKYEKIYGYNRFKIANLMETKPCMIPLFHKKGKIKKFFKYLDKYKN